jgi:hypothetical protein
MLFFRGSFFTVLFREWQGQLPPKEETGAALFCGRLPGFADGKSDILLLLLAPAVVS